jgi:hypothetical protein
MPDLNHIRTGRKHLKMTAFWDTATTLMMEAVRALEHRSAFMRLHSAGSAGVISGLSPGAEKVGEDF